MRNEFNVIATKTLFVDLSQPKTTFAHGQKQPFLIQGQANVRISYGSDLAGFQEALPMRAQILAFIRAFLSFIRSIYLSS